ncbi:MAG: DUF551 domain-containing protein [Flavobacteriales bacterium]|nr:DUF551 domain-containing protein [Flavobacteriales bacterium]
MADWISVTERSPEDGQRCLCHVPDNEVFLPGKSGAKEARPIVILRFAQDHFLKNPSKTGYNGSAHLWLGEGTSNRFFHEVTHWMPLPERP